MSLSVTLKNLTAQMLSDYYTPPATIAPTTQPSVDPTIYVNDPNYIKQLNKQFFQQYSIQVPNQYTHDRYDFATKNWELSGKSSTLPPAPQYVQMSDTGFETWWKDYCAGIVSGAQEAPPQMEFLVNFPQPEPPVILPEPLQVVTPSTASPVEI